MTGGRGCRHCRCSFHSHQVDAVAVAAHMRSSFLAAAVAASDIPSEPVNSLPNEHDVVPSVSVLAISPAADVADGADIAADTDSTEQNS